MAYGVAFGWIRWILFLPAALAGGYVMGGIVHALYEGIVADKGASDWAGNVAAFLAGFAHVLAALWIARSIAPSFKSIVVIVLSVFLVGDIAFAHLVLPDILEGAPQAAEQGGISVILNALRADDFAGLPKGGFIKAAGALIGALTMLYAIRPATHPRSRLSQS